VHVADPKKFAQFLRGVGTVDSDLTAKNLDSYLTSIERHLDATEKHYVFGPEETKAFAMARKNLATIRSDIAAAAKKADVIRIAESLVQREKGRGVGAVGGIGLGLGGLGLGGPVLGAAAGLAGLGADAFLRPMANVQRLASLKELVGRVDNHLGDAVKGFFSGKANPKLVGKVSAAKSEIEAKRIAQNIHELAGDPRKATARIQSALGETLVHSPATAGGANRTAIRAFTYLAQTAPKPPPPVSAFDTRKRPISDYDAAIYARRVEATMRPIQTVAVGLSTGRLTPEHVEAIKVVYPGLYGDIRARFMRELPNHKRALVYEKLNRLGALFDLPLTPYQSPEFVQSIQAGFQAEAERLEQDPAKSTSPSDVNLGKMVSNTRTGSQALEASK
jgi:hypothetical protein